MSNDRKLFRWLLLLMFIPLLLAFSARERFRYACQNPENWNTEQCSKPLCEINRQCPEHIFDNDKIVLDIIDTTPAKGATSK